MTPLTAAIVQGNRQEALRLTQGLVDAGTPPGEILVALMAGMDDVGARFKKNEVFVPEVLVAARAMKESLALLEPLLIQAGLTPDHKVVLGTVRGDLHDIGKNLVGMMLRGANFEVIDLGTDVKPERFVEAIQATGAQLVGLSSLLTTTLPAMQQAVQAVRASGVGPVKIMVGGAPVTRGYADQIGADGYAPDAPSAVDLARALSVA